MFNIKKSLLISVLISISVLIELIGKNYLILRYFIAGTIVIYFIFRLLKYIYISKFNYQSKRSPETIEGFKNLLSRIIIINLFGIIISSIWYIQINSTKCHMAPLNPVTLLFILGFINISAFIKLYNKYFFVINNRLIKLILSFFISIILSLTLLILSYIYTGLPGLCLGS